MTEIKILKYDVSDYDDFYHGIFGYNSTDVTVVDNGTVAKMPLEY